MSDAAEGAGRDVRRVLVLGANGPTGRLVVRRALDRGLDVRALTRHPADFPVAHDALEVVQGDATDAAVIDRAVEGVDAVVSAIGTAYTWQPVDVYSASGRLVVAAMRRSRARRIVVVTSMAAPREYHQGGPLRRLLFRLWRSSYTRTLYDDMVELERIVTASGLDWTIVRPPGLSDEPGRGAVAAPDLLDDPAMSRADLAAFLLDQLDDDRWFGRVVAVATPGLRLDVVRTIRKEVLKR